MSPGFGLDDRVDGAESRIRELADRLESLFGSLREPMPTPPWRIDEGDAALREELETQRLLAQSAQAELNSAREQLARAREQHELAQSELAVTRAELERAHSESGPIDLGIDRGVDPAVVSELEAKLALVERELEDTRKAHGQALDQLAAKLPEVGVTEDSVVRAMRAEDAMQQMQEHLQRQLLEHEETRRQRDQLRRSLEQLRSELRLAQQKRDHYKSQAKSGADDDERLRRLQRSVSARDKQIEELHAELRSKDRELETREKREAHLRQALNRRGGR